MQPDEASRAEATRLWKKAQPFSRHGDMALYIGVAFFLFGIFVGNYGARLAGGLVCWVSAALNGYAIYLRRRALRLIKRL